jgi:hypothetical protein
MDNKTKRQLLGDLLASADRQLRPSAIIRVQNDMIALGYPRVPEETIRLFLPKLVHSLFREYERQFGMDMVMLETTLPKIAQSVPGLLQWPSDVDGDIAIAIADALDACGGEWQARLAEAAEERDSEEGPGSNGAISNPDTKAPASPHRSTRSQAETRGRGLLDSYRRRVRHRQDSFQSLYNDNIVTDIAIYEHLNVDHSRFYKFLGDKLSPRTLDAKRLSTFLLSSDLPDPTWCNGERVHRKNT